VPHPLLDGCHYPATLVVPVEVDTTGEVTPAKFAFMLYHEELALAFFLENDPRPWPMQNNPWADGGNSNLRLTGSRSISGRQPGSVIRICLSNTRNI